MKKNIETSNGLFPFIYKLECSGNVFWTDNQKQIISNKKQLSLNYDFSTVNCRFSKQINTVITTFLQRDSNIMLQFLITKDSVFKDLPAEIVIGPFGKLFIHSFELLNAKTIMEVFLIGKE
jgi:hypothetical protein